MAPLEQAMVELLNAIREKDYLKMKRLLKDNPALKTVPEGLGWGQSVRDRLIHRCFTTAIQNKDFHTVKILREHGLPFDKLTNDEAYHIIWEALHSCYKPIINYLFKNGFSAPRSSVHYCLIKAPDLEIVLAVLNHCKDLNVDRMDYNICVVDYHTKLKSKLDKGFSLLGLALAHYDMDPKNCEILLEALLRRGVVLNKADEEIAKLCPEGFACLQQLLKARSVT